jgi:hypothetical protein
MSQQVPLAPESAQAWAAWPIHPWELYQLAIIAGQEAKTLSTRVCPHHHHPARAGTNPCGAGRLPKGTQKDGGRGIVHILLFDASRGPMKSRQ